MPISLRPATPDDAEQIAALLTAVADDLTRRFGTGHWSARATERGVRFALTRSTYYIHHRGSQMIATLALSRRKPWAIDPSYFTPAEQPLYLSSMAVLPQLQRTGIGSGCLQAIESVARTWPADAIRLDAYNTAAGAGGFYAAHNYQEVGRVAYKGTPLIYYEKML